MARDDGCVPGRQPSVMTVDIGDDAVFDLVGVKWEIGDHWWRWPQRCDVESDDPQAFVDGIRWLIVMANNVIIS